MSWWKFWKWFEMPYLPEPVGIRPDVFNIQPGAFNIDPKFYEIEKAVKLHREKILREEARRKALKKHWEEYFKELDKRRKEKQ